MLGCTNRSGCRIGHEHEELAYDAGDGAVRREPISKGYARRYLNETTQETFRPVSGWVVRVRACAHHRRVLKPR
jgi:hypothetical protein